MSQVNMSPPHISDSEPYPQKFPQPYTQGHPQPHTQDLPQYSQGPLQVNKPEGVQFQDQSPAVIAQNYRDQLFAQCAQGNHERKTEYGVCGIITAIFLFPCGLICLFMDKKETCLRCGVSLNKK